jgi:hypothetical protein
MPFMDIGKNSARLLQEIQPVVRPKKYTIGVHLKMLVENNRNSTVGSLNPKSEKMDNSNREDFIKFLFLCA